MPLVILFMLVAPAAFTLLLLGVIPLGIHRYIVLVIGSSLLLALLY